MFPEIIIILIVLAIVTVVGHGIWWVFARLFDAVLGKSHLCPYCHQSTREQERCEWCHRKFFSSPVSELSDLDAVERQLRRFRANGTLKPAVADQMLQRVAAYRQRLLVSPAPQTAPLARPVSQPVVAQPWPSEEQLVEVEIVSDPVTKPQAALMPEPKAEPDVVPHVPTPASPPAGPVVPPHVVAKPKPAAKPPVREATWSELLAGFMEEKNIHWGELIGGLLVVCCSIALVISLWKHIQQNFYLQFSIFVTVTSAVFGTGLHAYRRWKLESTGRGLLIIATLLVPLNFVAVAAFSRGIGLAGGSAPAVSASVALSPTTLAAEAISLAIFAWLAGLATQVLVSRARWLAVLGVVGNSAMILPAASAATGENYFSWYLLLGGASVTLFAIAVGGGVYRTTVDAAASRIRSRLDASQVVALFILLGVTAFAMLVSGGMLVDRAVESLDRVDLLHGLAALLSLAVLPALAVGLTVQRGTRHDLVLAGYRVAGTAIALVALGVMLVALGLAWPHPHWMIMLGAVDAAVLALAAWRWRMPILHAGAIACAALAYLTGFHYLTGHYYGDLPRAAAEFTSFDLLEMMLSARSGTALAGLFAVLALAAEALVRSGRRRDGLVYVGGSVVTAVTGLSLVTWHGLPLLATSSADTLRAAILYAIYGTVSLGLALRWRRAAFSYLGYALLAAVPAWLLAWRTDLPLLGPAWAITLAAEALTIDVIAMLVRGQFGGTWLDLLSGEFREPRTKRAEQGIFHNPLAHVAELVGILGGLLVIFNAGSRHEFLLIPAAACLATLWFLLGWQYASQQRTWIASVIVLCGTVHTLTYNYPGWVIRPWWVAILGHGTAALLGGFLAEQWAKRTGRPDEMSKVRRVLIGPLEDSALVSSILMLPAALVPPWEGPWSLAWCYIGLAAVWLVLTWRKGSVFLLALHQAAVSVAAMTFAVAVLQTWPPAIPLARLIEGTLIWQSWGIGLAVTSLGWIGVRMTIRKFAFMPQATAQANLVKALLENRYTVDRVVRLALPAIQALLLAACLVPDVVREYVDGRVVSAEAFESAAWILWGLLAATLLAAIWDRWRTGELIGSLLCVFSAACLVAAQFQQDLAVASALRWSLAGAGLAVSAGVWQRRRLAAFVQSVDARIELGPGAPRIARIGLIALLLAPVIALTLQAALLQLTAGSLPGPAAGSLFERLGADVSYLIPLLLVIAALAGHAIVERSPGYAFSAGLVEEMSVVLGFLLRAQLAKLPFDSRLLAGIDQWATIAAAAWGLVWFTARRWIDVAREGHKAAAAKAYMAVQVSMSLLGVAVLLAPALEVLALPVAYRQGINASLAGWIAAAGAWPGWLAIVLAAAAAGSWLLAHAPRNLLHAPAGLAFAGVALVACRVASRGEAVTPDALWQGLHVLQTGWTACGALLLAVVVAERWLRSTLAGSVRSEGSGNESWTQSAWPWRGMLDLLVLAMVVCNGFSDPARPWWSVGAVLAISAMAAYSALRLGHPAYTYYSGVLINLAGILIWWAEGPGRLPRLEWSPAVLISLVQANVLSLAAGSLVWSVLGKIPIAVGRDGDRREVKPLLAAYGRQAAVAGSCLLGAAVVFAIGVNLGRVPELHATRLDIAALAAIAVAAATLVWDRRRQLAWQLLYGLSLSAVGMRLWDQGLKARLLVWHGACEFAVLTLALAVAGWFLPRLRPLGRRLGVPMENDREGDSPAPAERKPEGPAEWFASAQTLLLASLATLAVWISMDAAFGPIVIALGGWNLAGRFAGPAVLAVLTCTAVVMTTACRGGLRNAWRSGCLALAVTALAAVGWARLDAAAAHPWLHRTLVLFVAASVMAAFARVALRPTRGDRNDWHWLGSVAVITLLLTVGQEVALFLLGITVQLSLLEIAAVAAGLGGLAAAAIAFAVRGDWDPLGGKDQERQVYVYLAEATLVVLGLHLRIVRPDLFGHLLREYWMFLCLGAAFTGAGLSEWFRRRNLPVLSEPLERTALLLPLLPAIGFWVRIDANHAMSLANRPPAMWFLMGVFYAVLAVSRRSVLCTILALAAGNIGLWVALDRHGIGLLLHPQVWLIPPALAMLLAEYLHRRRLNEGQRAAVRYLALSVIYVSSTADMFITGLGHDWRLPLVLMLLSVAGVLVGILLRIRSFLYLGATFLVVDILSILWYAAVQQQQKWILYVSGIVLGVAIIALFAVFEKRRNDVLAAVERLREWKR